MEQCMSVVDYYQHMRELCLSRRNFLNLIGLQNEVLF